MDNKDNRTIIKEAALLPDSLCIYRKLLDDPVLRAWRMLLKAAADGAAADGRLIKQYACFYNKLAENSDTLDLPGYVVRKLVLDENPFTLGAARPDPKGCPASVAAAAGRDLDILQTVSSLPPQNIKESCVAALQPDVSARLLIKELPEWDAARRDDMSPGSDPVEAICKLLLSGGKWSGHINDLQEFHRKNGAGCFAGYHAFLWQPDIPGGFLPIVNPDPVRLSDFVEYEAEREEVVRNTELFLNGYPANNVLLYGDRGTGKSSTVKALLNEYHKDGLRMIEVPKSKLGDYPEIVRRLSGRNHKFVIFVDDLAFEDNEENYTALKAALEGGLEKSPENVLIYATSNRKHLIKEKFSERAGLQYGSDEDEVRAADSIQEKLSLSDRFGITVVFSSPDKRRYLCIVDGLAARRGISMDSETLHKEAMKWELWYNGRSPRTAQQFINWLEGNKSL